MPSGPITAERQCRFVPSDAVTCVSAIRYQRPVYQISEACVSGQPSATNVASPQLLLYQALRY